MEPAPGEVSDFYFMCVFLLRVFFLLITRLLWKYISSRLFLVYSSVSSFCLTTFIFISIPQEKCVYCGMGELELCSPFVVGQSREGMCSNGGFVLWYLVLVFFSVQ